MKSTVLVFALGAALCVSGCGGSGAGAGGSDKRIAELEKQVGALQEQNRDVRAKLRTAHSFPTGNPLADFFASPEFWQCTYDSSWSDCSSRCSKQTSDGYNACIANNPEGQARIDCINKNTETGAACLKACPVQTSPTDPPTCRGGGGPA